jgi:hypothetical protein
MMVEFKGIKLSEAANKIIANDLIKPRKATKETKVFVKESMELIKEMNKDN